MFDTISATDNRLREKAVISVIYHRYIGFGSIYRENIGSVVHARISLIFQ